MPKATGDRPPSSLSDAIRSAVEPVDLMNRVIDQALSLVPRADGAAVLVWDEDDMMTVLSASGLVGRHIGARFRTDGSLAERALASGTTLHSADCATDPRVNREGIQISGIASMIAMPLSMGRETVGVLTLTARRTDAFLAEDVVMMDQLAEFISTVIGAAADLSRVTRELLARLDLDATATGPSAFVANVLTPGAASEVEARQRIEQVLAGARFTVLGQPIIALRTGGLIGVEALTRFHPRPIRPPDVWFAEAHDVGLGLELELATVQQALEMLDRLPPTAYLAINASPTTVAHPRLLKLLKPNASRIVVEITEHQRVDDYEALQTVTDGVRQSGMRIAVDDTGSGFASLSRILKIRPEIIKLDRELTERIQVDPVLRALTSSLVSFAAELGATIVAEGIESAPQLRTLMDLGIEYGQGFHLGPPAPLGSVLDAFPRVQSAFGVAPRHAAAPTVSQTEEESQTPPARSRLRLVEGTARRTASGIDQGMNERRTRTTMILPALMRAVGKAPAADWRTVELAEIGVQGARITTHLPLPRSRRWRLRCDLPRGRTNVTVEVEATVVSESRTPPSEETVLARDRYVYELDFHDLPARTEANLTAAIYWAQTQRPR